MATIEQATTDERAGPAAATIEVENPATGDVVGEVPELSPDQIAEMVARARAAQPGWLELGFDGRARVLRRAQRWITDNVDRVTRTIVAETGKSYEDAQLAEVGYGAAALGFWAKRAPRYLAEERVRTVSPFVLGRRLKVRYQPLGVVGVIGPWNYPLTNSFGDAIPALAAGNAVVLKPSSLTPLTSKLMEEMLLASGAPEGVYQVATGRGEAGSVLIDHVDFVQFTGSTETGRKIMERAARTLTPVGLELGGKDPMIVLRDADVEQAANAAVFFSMSNGGQTCISVERVYAEAPVYDRFVELVTEKVDALRQGESTGPGSVDVGAVTAPEQVDVIDGHVRDARERGARVTSGGRAVVNGGRFYQPTVIADVDATMECMREETFGPTLPVMRVADADEAVRLANDSPYGLAGSVFGKDVKRAEAVARRLEVGAVCVNDAQVNYFALEVPMGGWKASGVGSRHAKGGIRKYCAEQTVVIRRFAPKRDIYMFPFRAGVTRAFGRLLKLLYGRGSRN
jgi:acyl-CoA reductase-like NAD-dependent aldehyde dehydrogenase